MKDSIVGVLLAGGLARRFGGGDKGLVELCGKPLLDHVIDRAKPQVTHLILNANGAPERFADYGLDVVADVVDGYVGPLAGILTALEWTREHVPEALWVASFPTDAPVMPTDLVARLLAAVVEQGADMACAVSDGRTHPVIALWPVSIADALRTALVDEDIRKIDRFTARYRVAHVDFALAPHDPFLNINTPDDLACATRLLGGRDAATIPTQRRVGVVVERRPSANAWADETWRSIAVLADAPEDDTFRALVHDGAGERFYAGALAVQLFKRETADYKTNLTQPTPQLYIVLRPATGVDEPAVTPFLATCSPDEAESYTISGDMVVDAVPLPESLIAWLVAFVDAYHVDEPFKKRKQKKASDSASGRGTKGYGGARDGR